MQILHNHLKIRANTVENSAEGLGAAQSHRGGTRKDANTQQQIHANNVQHHTQRNAWT